MDDPFPGITLPGDRGRWEGAARGLCFELRRRLLASAARMVIEGALPCRIAAFEQEGRLWLRFTLGGPPFAFEIGEWSDLADIDGVDEAGTLAVGNPIGQPEREVLIRSVIGETGPTVGWSALNSVGRELDPAIRSLAGRMVEERDRGLAANGYRPVRLPVASGAMAPQFRFVRRGWPPTEANGFAPADLIADMSDHARLISPVPDGVESVMQVARLLWVHGWEEWQFLTTSAHYATLALETSLRLAFEHAVGNDAVLAGRVGDERTSAIGVRGYEAMRKAVVGWREPTVNRLPFPKSKPELAFFLPRVGVLTLWEARQVQVLLALRDDYSHPEFAEMQFISSARKTIEDAALYINLMWARAGGDEVEVGSLGPHAVGSTRLGTRRASARPQTR